MGKYKNADEYANSMEVTAKKVLKIIGLVILGIIFVVAIGFVVQGLWNWLMPMIFGLPHISYWQGVGLLLLAKILFGGISGSGNDSKGNSSSPKNEIRGAVGQAIHEEMQQEFRREFEEKCQADPSCQETSKTQDEVYDAWWKEEGENLFETYLKKEK